MDKTIQGRNNTIDFAKFVAIYMICIYHACNTSSIVHLYFANIALPLFYLLSGMFDKSATCTYSKCIVNSVKHLLVPFYALSIIALTTCWIAPHMHPELYPGFHSVYQCIIGGSIGIVLGYDAVTRYSFLPCGPLWYLMSLFCVKLIFTTLYKSIQHKQIVALLLTFVVIALIYIYRIPYFGLNSAIYGLAFYALGYLLRHKIMKLRSVKTLILIISLCVAIILMAVTRGDLSRTYMAASSYNNIVQFIVFGTVSSITVIVFSEIICRYTIGTMLIQCLCGIGGLTLIILFFHGYVIYAFKACFVVMYHTVDISWATSLMIGIVACICAIPLNKLITKYCPFILGKY